MVKILFYWRRLLVAAMLFLLATLAQAHQIVLTTGYANSSAPKTGAGIDQSNPPVTAGGGFSVGVRADLDNRKENLWFAPSFLFWNNLTGSPDNNSRINYFQIELGGRLSVHTHTLPKFYGGIGAGYTVAHAQKTNKADGSQENYDGDFPTASVHAGVKTFNPATGIGLLAEVSYHLGLEQPNSFHSVGPARAILIQIGVAFELLSGP